MPKPALLAASASDDLARDGLRLLAALAALLLVPAVLVVVTVAMLPAALFPGYPGLSGSLAHAAPLPARLPPAVPPDQLAVMVRVSRESGVSWELLAAIASVESDFGRNMATSWAGAIGYGQFMPASWAHWGQGGDPYDYRDAIPAMARYLLDHNVLEDMPYAVYRYNRDWDYVALVLGRAAAYATLGPDPRSAAAAGQAEVPR